MPARTRGSAGWRTVGDQRCYFRSKWEANYARYLEFLKGLGAIVSWAHEPITFWFDGIRRGCVSYLPDFLVVDGNGQAYHEVKGRMDAKSRTKLKRMAKYHPTVKMIVADGPVYRKLAATFKQVIPDWET